MEFFFFHKIWKRKRSLYRHYFSLPKIFHAWMASIKNLIDSIHQWKYVPSRTQNRAIKYRLRVDKTFIVAYLIISIVFVALCQNFLHFDINTVSNEVKIHLYFHILLTALWQQIHAHTHFDGWWRCGWWWCVTMNAIDSNKLCFCFSFAFSLSQSQFFNQQNVSTAYSTAKKAYF